MSPKRALSAVAANRAMGEEGTYRQVPENGDTDPVDPIYGFTEPFRGPLPEDREPDVLEFFEALDPALKRRRR